MIDIDHFKKINDTFGHAAGDEVLKEIACILRENLRDSDIIARFGGEEFCIFLSDTDKKSAFFIFERIRTAIETKLFRYGEKTIPVTVSAGLSCESLSGLENMINDADKLLYEAKKEGRNRIKISTC